MILSLTFRRSAAKRIFLLIAGLAWSMAGFFILSDGLKNLVHYSHHLQFHIILSFLSGALVYILIFKRISDKHANHIYSLKKQLTFHSGFDHFKSYLLVFMVIALLFYFKNKMFLHQVDTSVITIAFGISLFLSSIRFFYLLVFFRKFYKKYYIAQKYISL